MAKKVFISYAWDDEKFSQDILSFSNSLRSNGIDSIIDQYEENPDMGWPIWMETQIENADFVLVVATNKYLEKFKQHQEGKGVSWEISSIYQSLYELKGHNDKFIPIVFDESDKKFIVKALQPFTCYNINTQFNKLVNRIKGVPNVIKPPIVDDEKLPEKQRKSIFISSPIKIELWDKAKWMGVSFLYFPNMGWALGLVYSGSEGSAISIFEEWQSIKNIDDYLDISFIEGNIEHLPPNGYTCLIAPNFKKTIQSFTELNKTLHNPIIITITRFQRMYPNDGFKLYNQFKNIVKLNANKPLPIMPITMIDANKGFQFNNLRVHYDKTIFTKNIRYINYKDIKREDIEACVIPKYCPNFPESHKS